MARKITLTREQIKKEMGAQSKSAKVKLIDKKLPKMTVECGLFAYLAKMHLEKKRLDLSQITGAKHPKILGVFYPK